MQALLTFDKAPPFSVPARFFLSAPWFGVLAGLLVLFEGSAIFVSRWTPAALALTHLLSVGVLLQVMIGALFQILPVAAGANIPRPLFWARLLHPLLNAGALSMAAGFWRSHTALLTLGGGLVLLAVLIFLFLAGRALWRVPPTSPTIPAIKFALAGLLLTVSFGAWLLSVYALGMQGHAASLTAQHAAWGLIGWAAMLLVGVAYVVVPMFQLTPGYAAAFSRRLAPLIAALLVGWTLAQAADDGAAPLGGVVAAAVGSLLAAALSAFALITVGLQLKSKRPRPDASFRFWQLAMAMGALALAAWSVALWSPAAVGLPALVFTIGIAALFGALISVMSGMLYKILPFLAWMHMQNIGAALGVRKLPHMGSYLSEALAWRHFWLHALALALLLAAAVFGAALPGLTRFAGLATAVAFSCLGLNVLTAARAFRIARVGLSAAKASAAA
jgi:hypothetical protein